MWPASTLIIPLFTTVFPGPGTVLFSSFWDYHRVSISVGATLAVLQTRVQDLVDRVLAALMDLHRKEVQRYERPDVSPVV